MTQQTRLNKTDLRAIEARTEAEAQARLGSEPSIANLKGLDMSMGQRILSVVLDFIEGVGGAAVSIVAETLQSFAPIILMCFFIWLETDRLHAGAISLGQTNRQATIIAWGLMVANAVTPLYELRGHRGKKYIARKRQTLRGLLVIFGRRLFARPDEYRQNVSDNPSLRIAKSAILWSTIFFAAYSVLGEVFAMHAALPWYEAIGQLFIASNLNLFLQLLAGLLLSVGTIFFLQSVSFEFGLRAIRERPQSLSKVVKREREAYRKALADIRSEVTLQHTTGKLADQERKAAMGANPTPAPTAQRQTTFIETMDAGNGRGD